MLQGTVDYVVQCCTIHRNGERVFEWRAFSGCSRYLGKMVTTLLLASCDSFRLPLLAREMLRLQKRDWIILAAFIVAVAIGYGVYSKWTAEGLHRTEADMKSNVPLRVDQNHDLGRCKVRQNPQHLLVCNRQR
jgi:hypothetical protein